MDKSKYTEQKNSNYGLKWDITATEKNGMRFTKDSPENIKEGFYIGCSEVSGKDGVFLAHSIQVLTKDGLLGDVYSVSGGKVFDDKMKDVKLGTWVGIEYLGRQFKKGYEQSTHWSQTNSYHNWFIGTRTDVPSYSEVQKKSEAAGGVKTLTPVQNGMTPNNNFQKEGNNAIAPVSEDDLPPF